MLLVFAVLAAALLFEFINGFHDAANAIATVVATKVLSPRQAILLAVVGNLIGAFSGTAVAVTVGSGLVEGSALSPATMLAALLAAILWGLFTWRLGLPSSSSHALIGGLCGAALATTGLDWSVLKWSHGLWPKVIVPMLTSPLAGFCGGLVLMSVLRIACRRFAREVVNHRFGRLQLVSAAAMAFSHGCNDAQKTMGVIALSLFTATGAGIFAHLPPALSFLRTPAFHVAPWVIVLCAVTMGAGTAAGGWRIIRTLGHRIVKLEPVDGFAAETSASAVILAASHFGIPVSTTHVISTAIVGVGTTQGVGAVQWRVVYRMVWAWVFTLPVTAFLAYFVYWALAQRNVVEGLQPLS